jgi:hypothetical protein
MRHRMLPKRRPTVHIVDHSPRLALEQRELAQITPVVVQEIEGPHAGAAIVSIVTAGQLSNELRTLWNFASIRGL